MKLTSYRVRHVVESIGQEDALLVDVGRRLGEPGVLQAVGRPPWEIGPVRAGLE